MSYEVLGTGFTFTEAPRWHDDALWFSDFYDHRVVRWDGSDFHSVCEVAGQPSGLGFSPDGDLMVISMLDKKLLQLRSGRLECAADLDGRFEGPANDMCVDRFGRAYIGNDGKLDPLEPTVLLRRDPDATVSVVASDLYCPNGIVLSPDGRQLYVAESFAGRISTWKVHEDGSLFDRRTWANFGVIRNSTTAREARRHLLMVPDGMTMNVEGHLWVADAGGTGVWCLAEGGAVVGHVDTDPYTAYSAALGGQDGKSLFITAGPPLDEIHQDGRAQAAILVAHVDVPSAES